MIKHFSFSIMLIGSIVLFLQACQSVRPRIDQYVYISLDSNQVSYDQNIAEMIQPFQDSMSSSMQKVIGYAAIDLTKGQPESTLGNVVADLCDTMIFKKTSVQVDFVVLNLGGLRIQSIAAGPITMSKVYELMPFDNTLVIVDMLGSDLDVFFQRIIKAGGWPVSKQLNLIYSGNDIRATINNEAIQPQKVYRIGVNNYMSGGGDQCSFLKEQKQYDTGYLMRDAIKDYIIQKQEVGAKVSSTLDGRIKWTAQ